MPKCGRKEVRKLEGEGCNADAGDPRQSNREERAKKGAED
jgi:hypothetical protein